MTMRARALWLLALAVGICADAGAQRMRLNDIPSPTETYSIDLQWQAAQIRQVLTAMAGGDVAGAPPLTGNVSGVQVRFDTRAFVGKRARIFFALPSAINGVESSANIEVRWQTSGPFLAGAVRPGQSTLIFEGVIEQPVTGFVMDMTVALQNGATADTFYLEPYYELELVP